MEEGASQRSCPYHTQSIITMRGTLMLYRSCSIVSLCSTSARHQHRASMISAACSSCLSVCIVRRPVWKIQPLLLWAQILDPPTPGQCGHMQVRQQLLNSTSPLPVPVNLVRASRLQALRSSKDPLLFVDFVVFAPPQSVSMSKPLPVAGTSHHSRHKRDLKPSSKIHPACVANPL